jgi:outer membrane protein
VAQARGALELALRALEQLTGVPVPGVAAIGDVQPMHLLQGSAQAWAERADRESLDVAQAQALLAAQRLDIDIAKAAWQPTVELAVNATTTNSTRSNLGLTSSADGRSVSAGVSLSMLLWEPGQRQSRLRQSLATVEQSEQELFTARRNAALAARQAYTSLLSSVEQASALVQAVVSSELTLAGSERGRAVGSRTTLDVLNARQQLLQTRIQLTAARHAAALALLQLKAAAGGLAEADLLALNAHAQADAAPAR